MTVLECLKIALCGNRILMCPGICYVIKGMIGFVQYQMRPAVQTDDIVPASDLKSNQVSWP